MPGSGVPQRALVAASPHPVLLTWGAAADTEPANSLHAAPQADSRRPSGAPGRRRRAPQLHRRLGKAAVSPGVVLAAMMLPLRDGVDPLPWTLNPCTRKIRARTVTGVLTPTARPGSIASGSPTGEGSGAWWPGSTRSLTERPGTGPRRTRQIDDGEMGAEIALSKCGKWDSGEPGRKSRRDRADAWARGTSGSSRSDGGISAARYQRGHRPCSRGHRAVPRRGCHGCAVAPAQEAAGALVRGNAAFMT